MQQANSQSIGGAAGLSVVGTVNVFERTIHFSQAQAIIWQIKFILNQISSKKALTQASNEIESLSTKFGKDFDKYLLRELIDQIDLKDPVKASKDKNEPFKVQLLSQELARSILRPDFLLYFGEIAGQSFNDRLGDFMAELTKRVKLSLSNQIIVALSIVESCREESQPEGIRILKQKLLEYYHHGKPDTALPEYALHRILFLYSTHPEMNQDENRENIQQYLIDSNSLKSTSHISLRGALHQDAMYANMTIEEPSICLTKEGNGIDFLDKSYKMLEPWQLLIELGHFSSYNYNYLLKILEDFKDINEKMMARTLLNLAINHTGQDDQACKFAQNTFEANKRADSTLLKKEVSDKKNQISWSIDNLVRAFRELYSHLNWPKVFEALSEVPDEIYLDAKAFFTFLQITNKSKPQNLPYPLLLILQTQWASPLLQLSFIENSIQFYIEKKEKSIYFSKVGDRRQEIIDEITGIKDKVSTEFLHVWLSVDLVERLLILSDSHHFVKVRQIFEAPLKQVPEYLLLTLSLCKPTKGSLMIDELLSLLLPQFLGNHINSILVLQALWRNNQALMIRAVCELCRHEQRIMNLSRVLDITQEVKESLMPIVDCEDYYFAVNLAILAGKRDFLHYDVWLQRRITDVGTPFIKALLKYIKEHIVTPINDFQRRAPSSTAAEPTADQIELHKQQVLERSHLSREKLCITIENLSNTQNQTNPLIKQETRDQIREVIVKLSEFFPSFFAQNQNSEEIDNAANDQFQRVFQADQKDVEQRIQELIDTLQRFRNSDVKKEQEIYACMLHSLFDEYRFLHKYPNQYLDKIAKVYGAIIKNRIIDGTLQEIALKFVLEASRREGKRMKFSVTVLRNILDMLPQFPQFFEGIYELRHNIQATDEQSASLVKEIEQLYERTMGASSTRATTAKAPSGPSTTQSEEASSSFHHPYDENISSSKYMSNFGNESQNQEERKREESKGVKVSQQHQQQQQQQQLQEKEKFKEQGATSHSKQIEREYTGPTYQETSKVQAASSASKTTDKKTGGQQQAAESKKTAPQSQEGSRVGGGQSSNAPQVFNPTYKVREQPHQAQPAYQSFQPTIDQPTSAASGGQPNAQNNIGLNPSSQAFNRRLASSIGPQTGVTSAPPSSSSAPQQPQQYPHPAGPPLNFVDARPFRPAPMRSPAPTVTQPFNQQFYQMQLTIEQKLQKAISENARVKLEDVIEDSNLPAPSSEVQEEIKIIFNTTGKNNLHTKLEQLKGLVQQNPTVNLNWVIQFILIKRIQSVNLFPLMVDIIKQIGQKDSVSVTISHIVDLFRKCMLINEDHLNNVAIRPSGQSSLVKQYLGNLGTFLGLLTVASNRPIYAKELDIKQLLVEGFQSEKMRYVVTFVSRILKECSKSSIFKFQNPWVKAVLEIFREIYDFAIANSSNIQNEVMLEIDGLFKSFNISNIIDVQHSGFLKAALTQNCISQSQQAEIQHMINKPKIIPAVQPPVIPQVSQHPSVSPSPNLPFVGSPFPGGQTGEIMAPLNDLENQQILMNNSQHIFQNVAISQEFLGVLGLTQFKSSAQEQLLRKIVAKAVDQSIVEILPPVVDRSVTIALITTRELVLKDFAFDPDFEKILKAADLIIQNLAGSLALVTCREPLKMQLTNNLKRDLQLQVNQVLQLESTSNDIPMLSELQISDMAQHASKDNLELGCKMIKKAVIQKALTKVREDSQIARAIELRKESLSPEDFKLNALHDEQLIAQFNDLPEQLKPNPDGLSDAQFQVYEDFANLSAQSMAIAPGNSGAANTGIISIEGPRAEVVGASLDQIEDIESYLKQYETLATFDKRFEEQLGQKLELMSARPEQQGDQVKKLIQFCDNLFSSVCERLLAQSYSQQQPIQDKTVKILDFLSFVCANLKAGNQNLKSILTQKFLSQDGSFVYNTSLTLTLMKRDILSTQVWDTQIQSYVRDGQHFTHVIKDLFSFLKQFLEVAILSAPAGVTTSAKQKDFSYKDFPNIMQMIQNFAEKDQELAKFFENILHDHRHRTIWTPQTFRDYFDKWAVLSFEEGSQPQKQEQEVTRYFNSLKELGFYKDAKAVQKFCKAMIELSVEKALYMNDGVTKRPADRLVYRYIEIFLSQIVVFLMNFTSTGDGISKHEFMAQLFDAVHQVLDEDHKNKKGDFNQKPYYRLLISTLRVVGDNRLFNQKTQLQVLFSLADLFNKLNPKEYPAFSFAWLELISHKTFMPEFLQSASQSQIAGASQVASGVMSQSRKGGQMGGAGSHTTSIPANQLQQDNTYLLKCQKYKDLIVHLFSFLKCNMIVGQPMSVPLAKFYEATLRIVVVIKSDYPEFLCDFHFNLVNSLPEHCVQLKNIILSAQPRNIPYIDPFSKNLKVDQLPEISLPPRSQSNYENYLTFMNLREDLEKYFRTKEKGLIKQIAEKMMQSEEIINGRKRVNSSIFNAVALFIQNCAHQTKGKQQHAQKECYDILKQILLLLNKETRLCLLNSIVNELRYINSHTYFYSWMVIYIFNEDEYIQEQITRILIERLQTHDPHPWGLCITFRELLQNPKYNFARKGYILRNQDVIEQLMQTKLIKFQSYWSNNKQVIGQSAGTQQQHQQQQHMTQTQQQPH